MTTSYWRFALAFALVGCAGAKVKDVGSPADSPSAASSTSPPKPGKPEPFEAASSPADVVAPYVRPERNSRLGVPLPKGKARERWTFPLDAKMDAAFIVAAGSRVVVQGRGTPDRGHEGFVNAPFVMLDTKGHKIASDDLGGNLVRLVPEAGKLYAIGGSGMPTAWQLTDGSRGPDKLAGSDDPLSGGPLRGVQGPLAVRAALHDGTHVFIQPSGVEIDARKTGQQRTVVEPPVQALDIAIDDDANLQVIVRQDRELALWTTPLAGGSIGRIRLGAHRRDRADVPPILGKAVRVIVLDDRMIALGTDGKTLWERKGALTGGATITSDDRLLVATDAKVLAIDPQGRTTELATAPKEIFLTPPILTGAGLLLVASGAALHAYAFE